MLGLDPNIIKKLNYELSLKRIKNDIHSDFIYAPHINVIFYKADCELLKILSTKLRNGKFEPFLPITIEVPKSSGFTRPGSILWPLDRLAYQISVDEISLKAEDLINRSQVYSNILLKNDTNGFMFEPAGYSYSSFKNKIFEFCNNGNYSYVFKADVASFFERLYQHVLIQLVSSANCNILIVNFLEKLLNKFTQKDSHGIIQGVMPSDFLGNFYLCSLYAEHDIKGITSLRYVDDIYTFFNNERDALLHRIFICSCLRKDGLSLNESKSEIIEVEKLIHEETEVERLFQNVKDELESEFERQDFYSSTLLWDYYDEEEINEEEIELFATKTLFDFEEVTPETRNKIDKFCLPIFTAVKDDYAVEYVMNNYSIKPHLSQIYAKYLTTLIKSNSNIINETVKLLFDENIIYEYQLMWLYASLMSATRVNVKAVRKAIDNLRNKNLNEVLRAVCAIFIGKFGNAVHRRILKSDYSNEPSSYVRAAILYSVRNFPSSERNSCFSAWGGHSETNSLIVKAIKNV